MSQGLRFMKKIESPVRLTFNAKSIYLANIIDHERYLYISQTLNQAPDVTLEYYYKSGC